MSSDSASTSKIHETNIEKVIRLEAATENQLTAPLRYFGALGRIAGTPAFVALQISTVVLWVVANSGLVPGLHAFDPYPFAFLGMLLALEAVLLTSFVLIRQNRMSMLADRRSHLDLQINLLAEKEVTKVIQVLQRMSRQLGIEDQVADRETRELGKDTEVEKVAEDLAANLDANGRSDKSLDS